MNSDTRSQMPIMEMRMNGGVDGGTFSIVYPINA